MPTTLQETLKIIGRWLQIPAFFENAIPRPVEKKDIFTDTDILDE